MVLITIVFMGFINPFITGGGNQIVLRGSGDICAHPTDLRDLTRAFQSESSVGSCHTGDGDTLW